MMRQFTIGVVLFGICVAGLPSGADAQTITGRIDPEYDSGRRVYTYGPLYWDVTVAPEGTRSDEFSLNLYYNKVSAIMAVSLLCPDSDGDLARHALSVSAEHFISLTSGLFTGDDCEMFILGASSKNEVLSYRMAVSERVTRQTKKQIDSFSATGGFDGFGLAPAPVSATLDKLAAALRRNP